MWLRQLIDLPRHKRFFFEITSALEYLVIAGEEKMAKYEIEKAQDHLTLVSEPRLSTSLGPSGETGLSLLRPKARCVRGR